MASFLSEFILGARVRDLSGSRVGIVFLVMVRGTRRYDTWRPCCWSGSSVIGAADASHRVRGRMGVQGMFSSELPMVLARPRGSMKLGRCRAVQRG